MGSFVPSNGVGTGFTRRALEKLASAEHNLIFEPACLTEDYENGLRLHKFGCKQMFVPLTKCGESIVATREFFPRTVRTAIRQRSRWILGIGLQSWERHGWRGRPTEIYWFWRDRKGLFGNPISLLSNVVFFYGALTWIRSVFYRRTLGNREVCAAPLAAGRDARNPGGANHGANELHGKALRPSVCARGSAALGMRQLDQYDRDMEGSCASTCALDSGMSL